MFKIKKLILISLILIIGINLSSCFQNVEGYTKFSILEYNDFFKIETNEEKKMYLENEDLQNFAVNGVALVPFIKEISDSECALLMNAYTSKMLDSVSLERVVIVLSDDTEVFVTNEPVVLECINDWTDKMNLIGKFLKDDSWFYDGNRLTLKVLVHVKENDKSWTEEIVFNILLETYSGPAWQV